MPTRNPADRRAVEDLESLRVLEFLIHIEDRRGRSVQTRDQRPPAVRLRSLRRQS